MKVALIYLPHPYLIQPDAQAPLGLMYLGSILEAQGIDVELCNFSSVFTDEAISQVPDADLYGITVTSLELPQANRFAHLLRERRPDAKIVVGGPGTISPEYIDWNVIDSMCLGDGENAILEMVKDFPNLKKEYRCPAYSCLDDIPFPARHLLKDKQGGNIFAFNKNYEAGGSTVMITSRGCPFNCTFCTAPRLRDINAGMRYRSPQNIYDEMKFVVDNYGIKQFRFSDDMFTAKKKRVIETCELIGKLGVKWRISCRVKPLDEEMAKMLYDAGCVEFSLGIESFDDDVLKTFNKRTTAADNVRALEICDKVGIKTRALFMARTPGQTSETMKKNMYWLERVPFNIIACTLFVPIPGSDIWDHPEKYNIDILDKNLDNYNFYFFGKGGENKLKNIIKLHGRDMDEVNAETTEFREYLKNSGKLNNG